MDYTKKFNLRGKSIGLVIGILFMIAIIVCLSFCAGDGCVYAAERSTGSAVSELLSKHYTMRTDDKIFDRAAVDALLEKLGGNQATLATVAALGTKDAAYFRTQNGDDIAVTFGGLDWTVTHLTQDVNGNVVVTLWLGASADMQAWSLWQSDHPEYDYPSNMYSTSYIRAKALNSGGCGYVEDVAHAQGASKGLNQSLPQNADHEYAIFTMSGVRGSVTSHLVRPRDLAYQSSETMRTFNTAWHTCPNEAYGTPDSASYYNASMNYSAKDFYDEWADDYIWLPSIAETGYSGISGIWNLSSAQRSNAAGSWLRTGNDTSADDVCALDAGGSPSTLLAGSGSCAARPALHLNLTKAVADATDPIDAPTLGASQSDRVKAYNGAGQTFALSDYDAADMQIVAVSGKDPAGNAIAGDVSFEIGRASCRERVFGLV